jgi:hypothetical protein
VPLLNLLLLRADIVQNSSWSADSTNGEASGPKSKEIASSGPGESHAARGP